MTDHTENADDAMKQQIARILARIPGYATMDERDRGLIRCDVQERLERGWLVGDTLAWMLCLEEVNPALSEDEALARMAAIEAKYK